MTRLVGKNVGYCTYARSPPRVFTSALSAGAITRTAGLSRDETN